MSAPCPRKEDLRHWSGAAWRRALKCSTCWPAVEVDAQNEVGTGAGSVAPCVSDLHHTSVNQLPSRAEACAAGAFSCIGKHHVVLLAEWSNHG